MKKQIILLFIILLLFSGCISAPETAETSEEIKNEEQNVQIIVTHFHGHYQCISCKNVGEYALKTIQTCFEREYEKEIIEFRDIDGQDPNNYSIVEKYGVNHNSIYLNVITDGQENIFEVREVWSFWNNEEKYIEFFKSLLEKYLKGD
ncbi:MAG: nitrophenyl compound nitroreductase subunit ArsF family protein [Candidatus Syntropharchaeia archaeon]